MNVPREPEHYYPSDHAVVRSKERGIDWPLVVGAITSGEVRPSHKENCVLFVREIEVVEHPVGVVANYESGEILTVEWRKE